MMPGFETPRRLATLLQAAKRGATSPFSGQRGKSHSNPRLKRWEKSRRPRLRATCKKRGRDTRVSPARDGIRWQR
jgi:hypothetical protein